MEHVLQAYLVPTVRKSSFLEKIWKNLHFVFLRITIICVGGISNKQNRHILRKNGYQMILKYHKNQVLQILVKKYQAVKPCSVQIYM